MPMNLDQQLHPFRREQKSTLGVVAISKNEAREIVAYLMHLRSWVDEIVLVDDCSSDQTTALARATVPGIKIVEQPLDPVHGFAAQRNRGIVEATSDWLLHMDVDDRVTRDLQAEIQQTIRRPDHDAYSYRRFNFFLHRPMQGGVWQNWNRVRLARRGIHQFQNAVHEICVVDAPAQRIGQLKHPMWHLNDENYLERMRKSLQYGQAEAQAIALQHRVQWFHLLGMPIVHFMYAYIGKFGFRDGIPGLILSLHGACDTFWRHALAWDQQNRLPRPELPLSEQTREKP
ncbi:MAG: glycosyltransferase family 2 protein [Chloroflexaceae bacterium]